MEFIQDYTLKSLRLKPDKWNKLIISDEQRTFLTNFIERGSSRWRMSWSKLKDEPFIKHRNWIKNVTFFPPLNHTEHHCPATVYLQQHINVLGCNEGFEKVKCMRLSEFLFLWKNYFIFHWFHKIYEIEKCLSRFYLYWSIFCSGHPQELVISQNIGGQLQVIKTYRGGRCLKGC